MSHIFTGRSRLLDMDIPGKDIVSEQHAEVLLAPMASTAAYFAHARTAKGDKKEPEEIQCSI